MPVLLPTEQDPENCCTHCWENDGNWKYTFHRNYLSSGKNFNFPPHSLTSETLLHDVFRSSLSSLNPIY